MPGVVLKCRCGARFVAYRPQDTRCQRCVQEPWRFISWPDIYRTKPAKHEEEDKEDPR